jgi:hypothetical protein
LRLAGGAPVICVALLMSGAARGDALPKAAIPLSSDAIVKLYSGKTAIGKDADIYFAPDGTDKGVWGKPKTITAFMGTWSVSGNEICIYAFRKNAPVTLRDCYRYWRDGKRLVTLWSNRSDGAAVDESDGYYSGEEDKLKPGDLVSDKYDAAGGW